MNELIVLMIPFAGTTLGSAMVFLLKEKIGAALEKALLGFAAGVMIAASVWSLLIPSIEMTETTGKTGWIPALVGFIGGVLFLLILDRITPHLHPDSNSPEGPKTNLSKTAMLLFAVTLHNIPEGMAVGVAFAGAMMKNSGITAAGAAALSIGIAIQNFPEGAIISMPMLSSGLSKPKAFLCGVLSGAVEPVAGFLTVLIAAQIESVLPYLLAFAAGAMLFVVVEELIPESQKESSNVGNDIATIGFAVGFALMMVLDVALG